MHACVPIESWSWSWSYKEKAPACTHAQERLADRHGRAPVDARHVPRPAYLGACRAQPATVGPKVRPEFCCCGANMHVGNQYAAPSPSAREADDLYTLCEADLQGHPVYHQEWLHVYTCTDAQMHTYANARVQNGV
jgi:hypothetical protein